MHYYNLSIVYRYLILLSIFNMLENELVQVQKGEIFTTSKVIAEKLWVSHKIVLITIERIIKKNKDLGAFANAPKYEEKFIETKFKHWKTKIEFKWYLINEPWFLRFVMNGWNYDSIWIVQWAVIQAFCNMKEVLQNQSNNSWIEARKSWKQLRKLETDILKELTEYAEKETGKPIPYPLYSTYTQMTNKYLQFIVDVKDWKPIRDLSGIRDLWFIWIVDDRCKNAIIDWMNRRLPYKEIYYYAKDEVSKLVDALDFKPRLPQPQTQSSIMGA